MRNFITAISLIKFKQHDKLTNGEAKTKGLDCSLVSVEDETQENILILLLYYGIKSLLRGRQLSHNGILILSPPFANIYPQTKITLHLLWFSRNANTKIFGINWICINPICVLLRTRQVRVFVRYSLLRHHKNMENLQFCLFQKHFRDHNKEKPITGRIRWSFQISVQNWIANYPKPCLNLKHVFITEKFQSNSVRFICKMKQICYFPSPPEVEDESEGFNSKVVWNVKLCNKSPFGVLWRKC